LIHVVGEPSEELDADVWNITNHFEVISFQPLQDNAQQ
jgi:hypothetical protein